MIEIIDDRNTTIPELPKLPFITEFDDGMYLYYFESVNDDIRCLNLKSGIEQSGSFDSIQDAVKNFDSSEKIVNVQIRIVD